METVSSRATEMKSIIFKTDSFLERLLESEEESEQLLTVSKDVTMPVSGHIVPK